MSRTVEWDVVRVDSVVRIDLTRMDEVTEADTDAIVAAAAKLLTYPEIETVRLDGPALLGDEPPDGLKHAIRALDELAHRFGKQLVVGPI